MDKQDQTLEKMEPFCRRVRQLLTSAKELSMNCWESKRCGREAGGNKVAEFGVCPAFTKRAGEACWLVAGTFCGGAVQGTFAEKEKNCMACGFYKNFDLAHKGRVRKELGMV